MLGKCTRDLALILRYLWCNGDVLGEMCFLPVTTGMWRSSLMNALPLCGNIVIALPVSIWDCLHSDLLLVGTTLCFRKIMSSISLIVSRWLRNGDFPGLQNGKWILRVALSNSWTNSCNPWRQPTISSVQLRF